MRSLPTVRTGSQMSRTCRRPWGSVSGQLAPRHGQVGEKWQEYYLGLRAACLQGVERWPSPARRELQEKILRWHGESAVAGQVNDCVRTHISQLSQAV